MMKRTPTEKELEALGRARLGFTMTNYPAIIEGFMRKGIPAGEIEPRVNVLTYDAWRAAGRQVRKGEHGVKVLTFIPCKRKAEKEGEKERTYTRPWSTTVFHVSQTDPISEKGGAA